jgi:heterodisulfide reductase subunit C
MTETVLEYQPEKARSLVEEVMERSEQPLLACFQCRRCAAGCPVGDETEGITPDRLIRTILFGDREQAMGNLLIWRCVACYTCGTRCPNNIQTARINETLKHMAKEEHLEPKLPKVLAFHNSFCTAARHLGKVNELEFMALYEMKNTFRDLKSLKFTRLIGEYMSQAKLGLAMTTRRRMHFGIQKVKDLGELKRLFKKAKDKKEAARGASQDQE